MEEIYFCLRLTEKEHFIVEEEIKKVCLQYNATLKYYRQLKEGHVPLYREVKIVAEKENLNRVIHEITRKENSFLGLTFLNNPYKSQLL